MKRILTIILTVFILAGITGPLIGCGSELDEAGTAETQVVTVERGDLTIDITAAGNLALSRTEDLAIDLFYQEGTIEEVMVEEGDAVAKGQALVRLDTEEWEDELNTLEDQVTAKERDLLQAEINLQTAEQNLKNAQDNQTAKELALLNAQISLKNTEHQYDEARKIYTWPDVDTAQKDVESAEAFLEYALEMDLPEATVAYAQARLEAAEAVLDSKVNAYDTEEVQIAKMQVEAAELSLVQAEEDLNEVAKDVTVKELQLTLGQGKLEDAKKALIDAQEELDKAKEKSPFIEAPFDGFITTVNVEGGDDVLTGTVAVQLADPNKFEADIMVSEMDIIQVKLGGEAWVQVDAMSGLTFPAEVIHISPTSTIQSGVVNYEVKVEVKSLEAGMHKRQAAISEDFQLREGLTVTVTILVDERTDVLLVPSLAIISQGGQTYVQVANGDATEERAIETGISDWQFTEIISGLSEGEQVVVPKNTSPTTSTLQPRGPMGFPRPH
jgi:RND family efflux transporter MFP subunit